MVLLSDAKGVIDGINGKDDWALRPVILDKRFLSTSFSFILFSYVPTNELEVAHFLANQCH